MNSTLSQGRSMIVHLGLAGLRAEWNSSIVCMGVFDGVHLGHQSLLAPAAAQGRERELPSIAVTFDRNPLAQLRPDMTPKSLCTLDQKLAWLEDSGVSVAVVVPFDAALAELSAQDFLDSVLIASLKAGKLIIGHDFALGKGRQGTCEWLAERIDTQVISPLEIDGERSSSTLIRRAVKTGHMESAAKHLGRPYALKGVVVSGQKLGRTLGFPTVNLAFSSDLVLPEDGVYAAWAETRFGSYQAGVSIGMRPTVEGKGRTVEAFLIDYPGESLYSTPVTLQFHSRLRGEEKFDSLDALVVQMHKDIEECRVRLCQP
jgi:riboflavin kinase / FMN adenylyltransferase